MKEMSYLMLASMLMAQVAQAATIECSITRTNRYNDRDVATHSFSQYFDESARGTRTLACGKVRSFLIPRNAEVTYAFELVGRRETRLSLETVDNYYGHQVTSDETFGSIASAPGSVTNTFEVGDNEYTVECYLNE